jgi:hypothetical protein
LSQTLLPPTHTGCNDGKCVLPCSTEFILYNFLSGPKPRERNQDIAAFLPASCTFSLFFLTPSIGPRNDRLSPILMPPFDTFKNNEAQRRKDLVLSYFI